MIIRLKKNFAFSFLFVCIFIIIFFFISKVLTPVWNYPEYGDQIDDVITEYNELPKNSVQVLFLGTSHVAYGVTPIELYHSNKIVAYNMGTSDQGLDSSLLALLEAFKKQNPKVVFLDVSKIFRQSITSGDKNKLFDNMPLGRNTLRFALANGNGNSIRKNLIYLPERWTKLVPLYQYHSRWSDISSASSMRYIKKPLFLMGYNIFSVIYPLDAWKNGWKTVDDDMVKKMVVRNTKETFSFINNTYQESSDSNTPLYHPQIYEESYRYISAIKAACEQHGTKLVLMKIPSVNYPQFYEGTWTRIKHDMTVDFANQMELPFIDLKYDMNIDLDYTRDTVDGGQHLNLLGARKVTAALGKWLIDNYPIKNTNTIPEIEAKLPLYNNLCWVCELHLEDDFSSYISKLKSTDRNLAIFFTIGDTGLFEANDSEKAVLNDFGFQTNFKEIGYGDSFIGVFDNGTSQYECFSNREQDYSYNIDDKTNVKISSSGWECGSNASVIINDEEFALNWRGLHVVVYDKIAGMVIDTVCFDFLDPVNGFSRREITRTNKIKFNYQYYLYEHPESINYE